MIALLVRRSVGDRAVSSRTGSGVVSTSCRAARPPFRSLSRRGAHRPRGVEARLADGVAECHRRPAGNHRSRDGRPLRRVHGQRRDRRELADLPGGDCLHQFAVHRHGGAGGALHRRESARQGESDGVPSVPHRARDWPRRDGAVRLPDLPLSAGVGARHAAGARRGIAVPAHDVRVQHRPADVLHAGRSAASRRRRSDADAARHRDDDPQRGIQRHPDPGLGPDSRVRCEGCGHRHVRRQHSCLGRRHVAAPQRPADRDVPARDVLAS